MAMLSYHLDQIAAGGTVMNVLEDIVSRGGDQSNITIVCVVACPPALKKLSERFPGMLNPRHAAFQASACPYREAHTGHGFVTALESS